MSIILQDILTAGQTYDTTAYTTEGAQLLGNGKAILTFETPFGGGGEGVVDLDRLPLHKMDAEFIASVTPLTDSKMYIGLTGTDIILNESFPRTRRMVTFETGAWNYAGDPTDLSSEAAVYGYGKIGIGIRAGVGEPITDEYIVDLAKWGHRGITTSPVHQIRPVSSDAVAFLTVGADGQNNYGATLSNLQFLRTGETADVISSGANPCWLTGDGVVRLYKDYSTGTSQPTLDLSIAGFNEAFRFPFNEAADTPIEVLSGVIGYTPGSNI